MNRSEEAYAAWIGKPLESNVFIRTLDAASSTSVVGSANEIKFSDNRYVTKQDAEKIENDILCRLFILEDKFYKLKHFVAENMNITDKELEELI